MEPQVSIKNTRIVRGSLAFSSKTLTAISEIVLRFMAILFVVVSFILGLMVENQTISLVFVILGSAYQLFRMYVYFLGTIQWKKTSQKLINTRSSFETSPKVSIIVPCYNEEKVLMQSLTSLDSVDYSPMEIVVVDDGSSDCTLEIAKKFAQTAKNKINIITQKNSGKASTLNIGISVASGEFLLCVDADSLVDSQSIMSGLRHFINNPQVVAVAGAVHVANPNQWLTDYQSLEYGLGDLQKACLANFGAVNVIPGPIGLFRKSALEAIGGYETTNTTFAEDTELTLRLIAAGGKIVFEPKMISYTEVPDTWLPLIRQRYRWTRGIYQALRKNIENLLGVRLEKMNFFVSYLILEKVWTPIMDFSLLVFFLGQFVAHTKINFFVSYNLILFFSELILLFTVYWYSKRNIISQIFLLLASRFTFSIVITTWKFLSLNEEWMQVGMSWDKLERKGLRLFEKSV